MLGCSLSSAPERLQSAAPQALFIAAEDDELIRVSHAHSLLENYGALKSSVVRSAPLPLERACAMARFAEDLGSFTRAAHSGTRAALE